MPICVDILASGNLAIDNTPPADIIDCPLVLSDGADYQQADQLFNSGAYELLIAGGFNEEIFYIVITGCFLTWIAGLTIGHLISMIRKLKSTK